MKRLRPPIIFITLGLVLGLVWPSGEGHSDPPTLLATMGLIAPPQGPDLPAAASLPIFPELRLRINIPATTLEVYKGGAIVRRYPVSIGAPGFKSPVMQNQLTQLVWNPSWIPPDSPWAAGEKPAPPGPHNPLGPVKMPLEQGIRIHGTNKDKSIGRAASHGCFRMHNDDAAALAWFIQQHLSDKSDESFRETYAQNRTRTHVVHLLSPVQVDIVYEPIEVADRTLFLHPDIYGRGGKSRELIVAVVTAHGISESDIHPTFWQRVKIAARQKNSQIIPLVELTQPPDENRHLHKD